MSAGVYNITIEQGADFSLQFTWKDENGTPVDLSAYSARMQIRETFDSDEYLVSLTSAVGGGLTLGGSNGTVLIDISSSVTATLANQDAVYDIEMLSASNYVTRLMQGTVYVSREVTR